MTTESLSTSSIQLSTTSSSPSFRWQSVYMAYGVIMFFVLIIGFFGNVFTILVLRQREHRMKSITPLMVNLALADLFIIVFGYPAIIVSNLNGDLLFPESPLCVWSGFANGFSGMTCIATLTVMSGVVYQTVKRNFPPAHNVVPKRQITLLIASTWLYGFIVMLPPLVGWNRFVPGQASFSCAPEWTASNVASKAYISVLIVVGFLTPLVIIAVYYTLTFRTLKRRPMTGNAFLQAQRRKYQNKSILMTAVTIGAFLLSWSPYAFVSLTATVKGHHVMTSGESEIPELMAKASVIYNPIIYTFINDKFRHTLWGILSGNRGIILPRGRSGSEEPTEHGSVNAVHVSSRDP